MVKLHLYNYYTSNAYMLLIHKQPWYVAISQPDLILHTLLADHEVHMTNRRSGKISGQNSDCCNADHFQKPVFQLSRSMCVCLCVISVPSAHIYWWVEQCKPSLRRNAHQDETGQEPVLAAHGRWEGTPVRRGGREGGGGVGGEGGVWGKKQVSGV